MNLDARVAECLGWSETNCGSWVDKDGFIKIVCGFFEPSKCPTACEEVKKEIRKRCLENDWDYGCSIAHLNSGTKNKWLAEIHTPDGAFARYSDSEYEAVCLAFVAACGREA